MSEECRSRVTWDLTPDLSRTEDVQAVAGVGAVLRVLYRAVGPWMANPDLRPRFADYVADQASSAGCPSLVVEVTDQPCGHARVRVQVRAQVPWSWPGFLATISIHLPKPPAAEAPHA